MTPSCHFFVIFILQQKPRHMSLIRLHYAALIVRAYGQLRIISVSGELKLLRMGLHSLNHNGRNRLYIHAEHITAL